MKIGIYTPYLATLAGGEKYMLTLATCLAKYHDVSLFWNKNEEATIKEKARKKLGIDLKDIPFARNIFASSVSFASRFISSKNYDAIVVLSDGSIPFLWTKQYIHFQYPVEWVNGKGIKTKLKLYKTEKIICNSEFTKNFIDKEFGVKSTVVYPPVALQKTDGIKKENLILNVGRFGINWQGSSFKKQDVLVDAFKELVDKGLSRWGLVFVLGVKDEKDMQDIKKQAKGYPIEFVVNPDNTTLWEYYAKAKIYWHGAGFGEDLEKYPDRAEHFGIATVEAMGMGVVPIVISAGGQKEIVTHEKDGLLWNTTEELEKYTELLVNDSKKMEELSHAAKKRAEDFSPEKFCESMRSIIT